MIKVGIVGPEESKWIPVQIVTVRDEISRILFNYCKGYHYAEHYFNGFPGYKTVHDFEDIALVSGHCPKRGVDIWAEEIADKYGIKKEIYPAEVNGWNDEVKRKCYSCGSLNTIENYTENKYLKCLDCGTVDFWFPRWKKITLKGYRSRNIQIAEACDVLYCIVPRVFVGFNSTPFNKKCYCIHCGVWEHPTNGGCWTMKYAKKLGKETNLVIIE